MKPGDKVTVLNDTEIFEYFATRELQGEAWIYSSEGRVLCVRESWLRVVGTPVSDWPLGTKGTDNEGNVWLRCAGGAINTNPSIPGDFVAIWPDDQLQAKKVTAVIDSTVEITL